MINKYAKTRIKLPLMKRKDLRGFVGATGAGYVLSKYNRARINNGSDVGDVGRFFAENPTATMVGTNLVTGLVMAGKNKRNAFRENGMNKTSNEAPSEFEKYATSGFLTSKETEGRFLENHKTSDLKFVKLAFALEASGELDKLQDKLDSGGNKILDDYLKVAYDVCAEGIEKEANAIRRGIINGLSNFMSGGSVSILGSIPPAIAESAIRKVTNTGNKKAAELANKGIDVGIDKMLDFEDRMTAKKKNIAKAQSVNSSLNNLSSSPDYSGGIPKVASYSMSDAVAAVEKIDEAFMVRDLKSKASERATEYEKITFHKEALDSLIGDKIASMVRADKAIADFDKRLEDDNSNVGLEDELKIANSEEEDTLEEAIYNVRPDESLDLGPDDDGEKVDDSIWNEDPADMI